MRVQLTDGRVSLPGIEVDGAIANLSTQTPPGTKVLLLHKVEVQKGFILLDKHSLKILGGNVDHLIQKWTVTKIMPDSMGRSSAGLDDAPRFIAFGATKHSGVRSSSQSKTQRTGQRPPENKASVVSTRDATVGAMAKEEEREKMELPKSEVNLTRKAQLPRESDQRQGRGKSRQQGHEARQYSRQDESSSGEDKYSNYRGQQADRSTHSVNCVTN